jgi:hypothetical protein
LVIGPASEKSGRLNDARSDQPIASVSMFIRIGRLSGLPEHPQPGGFGKVLSPGKPASRELDLSMPRRFRTRLSTAGTAGTAVESSPDSGPAVYVAA